jgi:hypothetical protein
MVHEMIVHVAFSGTESIRSRILKYVTYHPPIDLETRIFRFEAAPENSAFRDALDRISGKESTTKFLEQYGSENSLALSEERGYLQELVDIRDKFLQVIDSMPDEYRSLLA